MDLYCPITVSINSLQIRKEALIKKYVKHKSKHKDIVLLCKPSGFFVYFLSGGLVNIMILIHHLYSSKREGGGGTREGEEHKGRTIMSELS